MGYICHQSADRAVLRGACHFQLDENIQVRVSNSPSPLFYFYLSPTCGISTKADEIRTVAIKLIWWGGG